MAKFNRFDLPERYLELQRLRLSSRPDPVNPADAMAWVHLMRVALYRSQVALQLVGYDVEPIKSARRRFQRVRQLDMVRKQLGLISSSDSGRLASMLQRERQILFDSLTPVELALPSELELTSREFLGAMALQTALVHRRLKKLSHKRNASNSHRLRLSIKRLRILAEMTNGAMPQTVISASTWQDALGEIQDLADAAAISFDRGYLEVSNHLKLSGKTKLGAIRLKGVARLCRMAERELIQFAADI